ncbi:hypothetical protein [Microbacterium sp. SLBN-111]|uniref:hypothetical protein n=1 Tax=Microbacterium sp. SLBN-111 TaxID=3377733 RepID=UPI003C7752E8
MARRLQLRFLIRAAAAAIAVVCATSVLTGAAAAHATSPASAMSLDTVDVSGEAWSGPAQPVTCRMTANTAFCSATDNTQNGEVVCYSNVQSSQGVVTVCSSYTGHEASLTATGVDGKRLKLEYGCAPLDLICPVWEQYARAQAISATVASYLVLQQMAFRTDGPLWEAMAGKWSFWSWAVLIVVFAAFVLAMVQAAASGRRDKLIGALGRTLATVFAIPATFWVLARIVPAMDELTAYAFSPDGAGGMFAQLQTTMWSGGSGWFGWTNLVTGLWIVGMFLLVFVFGFRNVALAALIMVAPIAWMLFPLEQVGKRWVIAWASAVAALLLTGPLTLSFLDMIMRGFAAAGTIWNPDVIPLLIGLIMTSITPFAVFGLFNFVGHVAVDAVGSRLGQSAGRTTANAASRGARALRGPSRANASPAGYRGARGPSAPGGQSGPTAPSGGPGPAPAGPGGGSPGPTGTPGPTPSAPGRSGGGPASPAPSPSSPSSPPGSRPPVTSTPPAAPSTPRPRGA